MDTKSNNTLNSSKVLKVSVVDCFRIGLVITLGVGVGLLIWQGVGILTSVLIYVGVAFFLALGLNPLIEWLKNKLGKRAFAVTLIALSFVVLIAAFIWATVPSLISQSISFVQNAPQHLETLKKTSLVSLFLEKFPGVLNPNSIEEKVKSFTEDPQNLSTIGTSALAVGSEIADMLGAVLVVGILTIYFMFSLPTIKETMYKLVPASRRAKFVEIAEDIFDSVGKFIMGQGVLGLINGTLMFIVLTLIGAPVPILLAFTAFLGSLIPLLGPPVSGAIIIISSLFISPVTGLIAGIYWAIYSLIDDYILTPRVMDKAVNIPSFAVIIAVLAGGAIGAAGGPATGVLGALVSIPLAASIAIIIREVAIPHQNKA